MKKLHLFILLNLIVGSVIAFAACTGTTLSVPKNLFINDDTLELSWSTVSDALAYEVKIGEIEKTTSRTSYSLESLDPGEYEITVRAIGNGNDINDSSWSQPISFVREEESGLRYKLINNNSAYEVTGIGTASGDVVLKDTYRKKPVVSIAAKAFSSNNRITGITILGENVKTIGDNAFRNCTYLEKVVLPESITHIGAYAFQSCSNIESITLPESVTEISEYAFSYCRGLSEIKFSSELTRINDFAFVGCVALLQFDMPDSVTYLGEGAFTNTNIESIKLSENLEIISKEAFSGCENLKSVEFGNKIQSIGEEAFYGCSMLNGVHIPDSVESIGKNAFFNCYSLDDVSLGSGLTSMDSGVFGYTKLWTEATQAEEPYVIVDGWIVYSNNWEAEEINLPEGIIGLANSVLSYRKNVSVIILPQSVKYIGNQAFDGCENLTGISMLGVESIGELAFWECKKLSTVIFGENLKVIGRWAFLSCEALSEIDLPESVESIGMYAFSGTRLPAVENVIYADNWAVGYVLTQPSEEGIPLIVREGTVGVSDYAFSSYASQMGMPVAGVGSVFFPDTVTKMGYGVFYDNIFLEVVTLPDGMEAIGEYMFYGCTQLTDVTMPSTIKSIGRSAFYGCTLFGKNGFAIPEAVEDIDAYAFYNCSSLVISDFGANLESIGQRAFFNCLSLGKVTLPSSLKVINERSFMNSGITELSFGEQSQLESIGKYAFNGCVSLSRVALPENVNIIDDHVFKNCKALTTINIDGAESIGQYALRGCESITNLVLPENLTSLGAYALRGCSSLYSVVLASNVEFIGNHAFYGNKKMTIYTELEQEGAGWAKNWNSSYRPIVWGCTLSEDKTYVVSFIKTRNSISNKSATNGISAPYREGYVFVGWSETEGSNEVDYTAAEVTKARNGQILYAVWL